MAEVKDKVVTVESLKAVYDTLNENKAPSGYGLGDESLREVTLSELDTLDGNGWYLVDNNQTGMAVNNVYFNYALLRVSSTNTGWNVIQELFTLTTERVKIVRSRKSDTEWYDWECENPPMVEGREYCTMERHNGESVYVKLVDIGELPNNTEKTIENFVSNVKSLVDASFVYGRISGTYPMYTGKAQDINWYVSAYSDGKAFLIIKTTSDLSANKGYLTLKYTKK